MTDFTKFNPVVAFQANGVIVGYSKMEFFKPDASASDYADPTIPDMQLQLTKLFAALEGIEMRHLILLIDNLKNMVESSAHGAGMAVASMLADSPNFSVEQKDKAFETLKGYFNHMEEEEEHPDAAEMLHKFFVKPGQKPN